MHPKRIIYLPIEAYKSRYSQYTSIVDGVYETCFKELGIPFIALRPDTELKSIKQGQVLDVASRTAWGFSQVNSLIELMLGGELDPETDCIYIEDFWLPGFEQIMYAQSSKFGQSKYDHIPVYSFCHAQSIDKNDFTYKWKWWISDLEKAWFDYQTGVFCAAPELISMAMDARWSIINGNNGMYKMNAVGHAFHEDVMWRCAGSPQLKPFRERTKQVVYSARWDVEKNPGFFMDLMEAVYKERPDIKFIISTGGLLTSNSPKLLARLNDGLKANVEVRQNRTLPQYYQLLNSSRVNFNCAAQDFISYCLLDAAIMGCAPLYPNYLTFPAALNRNEKHLYTNLNLESAKAKLYALIDAPEDTSIDYTWITNKYKSSVKHMCQHMGFAV